MSHCQQQQSYSGLPRSPGRLYLILTNVSRSFSRGYVPVELMLPAREAILVLTKFIFR